MGVEQYGDHGDVWRIEQRNEGGTLWLYDEAHIWPLRAAGIDLRAAEDRASVADRAVLTGWAREGMLRICELEQDGPLDLLVFVGRRPDPAELHALGRWHPPLVTQLSLPSGHLCVEGGLALRLVGDGVPDEPTAVLEVAPGEYRMALFNMDFDQLHQDRPHWGSDAPAPWQILALERVDHRVAAVFDQIEAVRGPLRGFEALRVLDAIGALDTPGDLDALGDLNDPDDLGDFDLSPFLPWAAPLHQPAWFGAYEIEDGVFHGLYSAPDDWDRLHLNLDAAAAAAMNLAAGDLLSVTTDLGEIRALFYGATPPPAGPPDPTHLARLQGFVDAAGAFMSDQRGHGLMLSLVRWTTAGQRYVKRAAWQAVTVRRYP
jgi:hypothetical protein